jgi:hypothetical protein
LPGDPYLWSKAGGTPQRIVLRRSVALHGAAAGFALIAALAVYACAAPHCGIGHAVVLATVALGSLMLGLVAYERRQPVALKIGPDGIAASGRSGAVLFAGRVAGCAQWPRFLLILAVAGRARPLLIPADSVPAESFRELAVKARRGAR